MATNNERRQQLTIGSVGDSLVRSVIARPLAELIEREQAIIDPVRKVLLGRDRPYAGAVFVDPEFPDGV